MRRLELKDIDLNLLVVFDRLLVERRVSRVAEALGLSQPAISNALARLRRMTGDELFLRTPAGMAPTPFAEQMAAPVADALGLIHSAINRRGAFDPSTAERGFTIGMTDIGEIFFLPKLMNELARVAPGITISTIRNSAVNLKDEMEAGHVDAAIGLLPRLQAGFFQRRLFRQRYVCLFRRGHRLDRRRITLGDFQAADHVLVVAEGTGHGRVDELLHRAGVRRRVRLSVPHFVAVGHILQDTDMIATVPERLATALAGPFGLVHLPHPAALPEIAIKLFWHARNQRDPDNEWLRRLLIGLHADAV